MDLDTFTWFAVLLVAGLVALAVTAHVLATDEGLTTIRARLRRRRTVKHSTERFTPTLEGHDHERDND